MGGELFANRPAGTVTSGGTTAPAAGTVETWTVTVTAAFPAVSAGTQFHGVDPALPTEWFLVTACPGGTGSQSWTVTRGAESSAPAAHAAGFTVADVVTAGALGVFAQAGQGDLGGSGAAPTVTGTHLSSPMPLAQGGTGTSAATAAALLDTLGGLDAAENLAELASAATARTNLGLGSAATQPATAFDAAGAAAAVQAASLPTLTEVSASASATLALNKITVVTAAAGALTMTLPASVANSLIVCERAAASTATVAVTGNIRGVPAVTITFSLAAESEMFLGDGTTWWPVAAHKTLSSLQALFAQVANNLSDLASASTARTNLGLGAAALLGTPIPAANLPSLDAITAPAAAVSLNSKKITSLANGSAATDAAAFGQIPVADATAGDIQASPGTAAAGGNAKWADSGHVHPQPPAFAPTGLTGATTASRYVGATPSGAPATGTFAVGDFVITQAGNFWACTVAGTPGTWVKTGQLDATAADIAAVGTQAAGAVGKAADAGHVHPATGLLASMAATSTAGYTLVNSTGDIITWTAPNDGALHRFVAIADLNCTLAETGGQIVVNWTQPNGNAVTGSTQLIAGGRATGATQGQVVGHVQAGQAVTVHQQTALSAGAAVLWADIMAS